MDLGVDFEIHAGDFKKGKFPHFFNLTKSMMKLPNKGDFFRENIYLFEIAELEIASEESVNRIGGALSWGLVGSVLIGPMGLLAGLICGGRGKDVTFVCKLKDGRKFLATVSSDNYKKLQAAIF